MAMIMAAMAAVSVIQQQSAKKKQMAAAVADGRLQLKKFKESRTRLMDNTSAQETSIKTNASRIEQRIEKNKIDAESKLDSTFAGSGISGDSIDSLDNQITAEVSNNKRRNKEELEAKLSSSARSFDKASKDNSDAAANIGEGGPTNDFGSAAKAGITGAIAGNKLDNARSSSKGASTGDYLSAISSGLGF